MSSLQVFIQVYVTVLDENDNPPVFSQPSYQSQVEEGLASAIVTTVEASDRDLGVNSEIRFNLTGTSAEVFTIDPIEVRFKLTEEILANFFLIDFTIDQIKVRFNHLEDYCISEILLA